MLTQSGSSINENLESTDDGFDVEALINGRSKLFIDGKFYHAYLDQELINILEIEETSLEKPVTELFIKKLKETQEGKLSEDVTSISFVYYKNSKNEICICCQPNAPL